jgi:predicted DCC family thiol-disulfide oxidoreductase YuxK
MIAGRVLVFDGVCVLCSRWVSFVLRHDRANLYKFSAMQSPTGRALLIQHDINPDDPLSFLLLEDGLPFTDTDAIIRVLRSFGGLWRMSAAVACLMPRWMRDRGYRWIARNRYRLSGQRGACFVPVSSIADRFIH